MHDSYAVRTTAHLKVAKSRVVVHPAIQDVAVIALFDECPSEIAATVL